MGKRLIQLSQKQERGSAGGGVVVKRRGWGGGVSWCNSCRAAERVVFQSGKVLRHRSGLPHLPQASPTPSSRSHKSSIKQPLAGDCKGSARNFCLCAAANTTSSSSSTRTLCVERSSSLLLVLVRFGGRGPDQHQNRCLFHALGWSLQDVVHRTV